MTEQYIKSIDIKGYRNLKDTFAEFSEGINVIHGENGQGKTNFMESVWLLCGGKSFRGSKDSEMIGFEKSEFRIEGTVVSDEREKKIIVACSKENPKFVNRMAKVGSGDFLSPSKIIGNFYCVIFSPVHLNILSGGPSLRRKFIDACLCQLYPKFLESYREYTGALNTRNSLLKSVDKYSRQQVEAIVEVVNDKLARSGCVIDEHRKRFVDFLMEKRCNYYADISNERENMTIKYNPVATDVEAVKEMFIKSFERDKAIGYTTVGVQREDIDIYLDGRSAKDFASQGQQRSVVIALKLAESDFIKEVTGINPVILLDDVLSELDFGRQDYILNSIEGKQVFITCCDTRRIKRSCAKKFFVEDGEISECM